MDFCRDTPLFDRQLTVKLPSTQTGLGDIREIPLTFRILQGTSSRNQQDRHLHFELTDENDPCFLYILELSEQDFPSLKRDQSILVDFNAFPTMLIELLTLCVSENGHYRSEFEAAVPGSGTDEGGGGESFVSTAPNSCSYSVKLDTSTGLLSIVESNKFKQVGCYPSRFIIILQSLKSHILTISSSYIYRSNFGQETTRQSRRI